jgi:iron complex transport system ATP-binding protein
MELRAENLAFGYRSQPVGRDVDLKLTPGRVLCLLGPNGSGKTTLFKTLLGLLPPQGGSVTLEGRDLAALSRTDIARRVSYVPQAHDAVFPYTVLDMVLMGRTVHRGVFASPGDEDRLKAEASLADLGLHALAAREYTRISGGQRQLALVARALAQEAALMVMDEPTASLDFGNQVLVLEQVKRLAATGLGIVFSTHNPDHAFACATDVLVLKDGISRAAGAPAEVLTEDLLSSIYGVDVRLEVLAGGHRVCVPPALSG